MTDDADDAATRRGPELFGKIGEAKLRAVITDFYSRVFGDVMIGFMFEGKSRQHLIDREYEFTASFLGGDVKYTGRPMRTAHARTPIFGGHFERRLQILRETLRDNAVDPDVQRVWIDHTLALRDQITSDKGSECKDTSVVAPEGPQPAPDPHEGDPRAEESPILTSFGPAIDQSPSGPEARVKLGRRKG